MDQPPEAPAFFLPDGEAFVATAHTRGPWSSAHQHGGPPSALLGREVEAVVAGEIPLMPVRFTIDLLRPVPIGRLRPRAQVTRATRSVRLVEAALEAEGVEVLRASALFLRRADISLPPLPPPDAPPPLPETGVDSGFPFFRDRLGYHTAMEIRFVRGGFGQARSTGWLRMRYPLVAGEVPSPLLRVLVAADSGNGITNVLDIDRFTFVNPDLSVHLHRLPEGEWIGLDAYTQPEPSGVGLAQSRLSDTRGPLGHALQSLLVTQRSGHEGKAG
ncbi:MAG TPA: thioesterase family protein [Polyangia bacterium]|nr:thioesterase family protein [Polyangia bacterium]